MNNNPSASQTRRQSRSLTDYVLLALMAMSVVSVIVSIYFVEHPAEHTTADDWTWICIISGIVSLTAVFMVCLRHLRRRR